MEESPDTPLEVLLCWATTARNCLQMWHGYSSYQMVFGKNPNLPNIMSDGLPALEGTNGSEALARHLNALHAARRAFIQSEADERIRRALRAKVRAAEKVYQQGDRVYYKCEGHNRWLGPGKVVFQDGKIVFVRHGGTFVRVSPNRLIKAGAEFVAKGNDEPGSGNCEAGGGHQDLQSKEEAQHESTRSKPVLDKSRSVIWSEDCLKWLELTLVLRHHLTVQ